MKKRDQKNRIPFTARKSSWLIVLCIGMALIILLPRTIILAKYAMNLYDYTGVSAGDFHFTSDYMNNLKKESMHLTTISGWNGDPQTAILEIRNYDNAYRYNGAETDVWYYFDVKLYCGENMTTVTDETKLTVNDKAEYTVKVQSKETSGSGDSAKTVSTDITLYTYVDEEGNAYPCACLNGIEKSFTRSLGTHYLTVAVSSFGEENKDLDQRLSVEAHTITADKLSNIKDVVYDKKNTGVNSTTTAKSGTTAVGVFEADLKGAICYTHSADIQEVSASYTKTEDDSRLHHYSLFCTSVAGTSSRVVRIYYDTEIFTFSDNPSTTLTAESGENPQRSYAFFDVEIQANSMLALSVLTPWEGAGPADGGDAALTIKDSELIRTDKSTSRTVGITNNYALWFEVQGEKAEKHTVIEDYKTLKWYSEHVEDNSYDTLNGTVILKSGETGASKPGFMYVDAAAHNETEGTKMNRVRLYLAEEIPAGETRTITVGKVLVQDDKYVIGDNTDASDPDFEVITVESEQSALGSYIELELRNTITLGKNERFFIGSSTDTLKFLYRYKKTAEESKKESSSAESSSAESSSAESSSAETSSTEETTADSPVTAPFVDNVVSGDVNSATYDDANLSVDFGYYG